MDPSRCGVQWVPWKSAALEFTQNKLGKGVVKKGIPNKATAFTTWTELQTIHI